MAPDETALVAQFTRRTGQPPERKQLVFLRNLLVAHRALRGYGGYLDPWHLQNLAPGRYRYQLFAGGGLLHDRWAQPPASALDFWQHVALVFHERQIPLPPFMAPLTDLGQARHDVETHRAERQLRAWREKFTALERQLTHTPRPAAPRTLRLRLARKKPVWELSAGDASGRFMPLPAAELRDLLDHPGRAAHTLDPGSTAVLAFLRANRSLRGRTAINLPDREDRALLAHLLQHPQARTCVVGDSGAPLTADPRPVVWQFRDHPDKPDRILADLAFADGTAVPRPLLHLPAEPALYLHAGSGSFFTGLPPPDETKADPLAVEIPRTALATPEAGRFAARAGLALPGDISGRFRHETLRARVRCWLAPPRPAEPGEVLVTELAALAPDGTPRALFHSGGWQRDTAPGSRRRPTPRSCF